MENNNTNLQLKEQPTSQTPSSPNRKSKLRQSVAAVLASAQTLVPSAATTAGVAGGAVMLTACETEQVDPEGVLSREEQLAKWHEEAEAYANSQGWSQGVRSLVAGVIDYHYFKESANGPILIRVSYQVDVDDFIQKIEADAAARGTYDPRTEGVLQASLISLEGDYKNNAWFIPSSAFYEAKAQGKKSLNLGVGEYPAPVPNFNNIAPTEGLVPNKEMQIYSGYGIKNATKVEDRIKDQEKRGPLKDIL